MKKLIRLTPKQLTYMQADARIKAWVGNRGAGKSLLAGAIIQQAMAEMPRGKMILAGNTLQHLMNIEIPAIVEYLTTKAGFIEVTKQNQLGHFCIGKTPPKYFTKPFLSPESYGTVISFYNGFHIQLVSLYKRDAGRGITADCGILTEAATIDPQRFWSSLFPTVRGPEKKYYRHHIGNPKGYLTWYLFSNMPWDTQGEWLFTLEEMAQEKPKQYYYQESTIWDAECIYGREYIENIRYSLMKTDPLVWEIEYLNKRVGRIGSAFYSELTDKHVDDTTMYDYNQPIAISLDFGNTFNCMTVWQDITPYLVQIDELFIKGNVLIDKLVQDFTNQYQYHHTKVVEVYGDVNGNVTKYDELNTLLDRVIELLTNAGWQPNRCVTGTYNTDHALKQQRINRVLSEQEDGLPIIRFVSTGTYNTRASMKAANLTNKFRKDKSSETKQKHIPPERATHLSDTVDYIIYEKTKSYFDQTAGNGFGVKF